MPVTKYYLNKHKKDINQFEIKRFLEILMCKKDFFTWIKNVANTLKS